MERYLIQVSHEPHESACARAMKMFMDLGTHFIGNADWGCQDDVHTAWVIVESEDKDHARLVVPPLMRREAVIVRLNRYSFEEMREMARQLE